MNPGGAGRRITIRLDTQAYEKLRAKSQAVDLDLSFLVRDALAKYLDQKAPEAREDRGAGGLVMPDEAFALTGPYRAWSGDLRTELRERFLDLMAIAHSAAQTWPKSAGIREVYAGLLSLAHNLGIGTGGGRA